MHVWFSPCISLLNAETPCLGRTASAQLIHQATVRMRGVHDHHEKFAHLNAQGIPSPSWRVGIVRCKGPQVDLAAIRICWYHQKSVALFPSFHRHLK